MALVAAAFAVYALVQPAADSGSAASSSPAKTQTVGAEQPSVNSLKRAKSYEVKAGDTLSGIATKTGLTIEHIVKANPGLDANTLGVGRQVKLRD